MLTDAAIKSLRPKHKMYKVADCDGMYVRVMPTGTISFRLDYRLNGRRESVHLGKYGRHGISLLRAANCAWMQGVRSGKDALRRLRGSVKSVVLKRPRALASSARSGLPVPKWQTAPDQFAA